MDQQILDSIPHQLHGAAETIELDHGYTATIRLEYDNDIGAPWEQFPGHGPISDWRSKDSKSPGERVLCEDRGRARYIGVCVEVTAPDGTRADASLWGVEDSDGYWRTMAAELIEECLAEVKAEQQADMVRRAFT